MKVVLRSIASAAEIGAALLIVTSLIAVLYSNTAAKPATAGYAATHSAPPRPVVVHRSGPWIEIPDLGIALPLIKGDGSDHIPYWSALVYPGTTWPGFPGNSYVYAHGVQGMFGNLFSAKIGQRVIVHDYTTGGNVVMHVQRVLGFVPYTDLTWVHWRSASPALTLQTCQTDNIKDPRFLIQAW